MLDQGRYLSCARCLTSQFSGIRCFHQATVVGRVFTLEKNLLPFASASFRKFAQIARNSAFLRPFASIKFARKLVFCAYICGSKFARNLFLRANCVPQICAQIRSRTQICVPQICAQNAFCAQICGSKFRANEFKNYLSLNLSSLIFFF